MECFTPATGCDAKKGRFNQPLMPEGVFPAVGLTSHQAVGEIPLVNVAERPEVMLLRKESIAARLLRLRAALRHNYRDSGADFDCI